MHNFKDHLSKSSRAHIPNPNRHTRQVILSEKDLLFKFEQASIECYPNTIPNIKLTILHRQVESWKVGKIYVIERSISFQPIDRMAAHE
jgi:hypothetical protein